MAKKYVCIRKCYYLNTLFYVGDVLPAGVKPNKHFVVEGNEPIEEDKVIVVAGDDARSTDQIIADANELGCNLDPETPRKEAFASWKKADEAPTKKPAAEPEPPAKEEGKNETGEEDKTETPGTTAPEQPLDTTDALGGKKFAECTPDQLNNPTNAALGELIKTRFNSDVKFAGKSKKQLIEMGLKLEAKQAGAKAP